MKRYLDTSLVIAALTSEERTVAVHDWLDEKVRARSGATGLVVSDWTVTEIASALSLKIRTGQIGPNDRHDIDDVLSAWLEASLDRVPVPRTAFLDAARLLRHHDTGLRAGDALHLATADHHGIPLVTLDRTMAHAGSALGVRTELV
ncbi:MAG: type II toxin-antitoxin system VapC family toxin [Trueperaceae bacterium]